MTETDIPWFSQTGPGDVSVATSTVDARSAAGPPPVAVLTEGGRLYLRTDTGEWRALGVPPDDPAGAFAAACLTLDAAGTVAPVVVGDDGQVWLVQPEDGAPVWTGLGAPADGAVDVAATTLRRPTGLRHVLLAGTADGRLWLREGVDPEGTWFPLPADPQWHFDEFAMATAAPAPGTPHELHLIAVVSGTGSGLSEMRVAVRENAVWTWVDPGQRPDGADAAGLTATGVRDGTGAVQACAVLGPHFFSSGGADRVCLLIGARRTWRWVDLGRPVADAGSLRAAVVVRGDPSPGGPLVVARSGHHHWRRTPESPWEDLGLTPGDVAVVEPRSCLDLGPGEPRRLRTVGVSWSGHLWTVDVDGDGAATRWRDHGVPSAAELVVGVYTDPPDEDVLGLLSHVFVIDTEGCLFESRLGGTQLDSWDGHDRPTPTTGCRSGVGALTIPGPAGQRSWAFVLGTDGHLWGRHSGPDGWEWVDHRVPSDRNIETAGDPVATEPLTGEPTVPVVGDDGQLWLRTPVGGAWTWVGRGTPPGLLIFALVGAVRVPSAQGSRVVTAVVTDDGRLFVDLPQGTGNDWVDLGTPLPGERVVAGIGAELVTAEGAAVLHLVVATAPGGHVWTRAWKPGVSGSGWTDLGRPPGPRIEGAVGVVPNPDDASAALVFVLADGRKLWARDSAGRDPAWTPWGLPFRDAPLASGCVATLTTRTAAFMTDSTRSIWVATTEDF